MVETKMSIKKLCQIEQEGLNVLFGKYGPDDAIRFLRIYEQEIGDWTKDRKKYLEKDPEKLIKNINERRKKQPTS